ncbi:MAG: FKBP-type peptidyl-prolyl cis-trans isomerase [Bacteroidia bacterium]
MRYLIAVLFVLSMSACGSNASLEKPASEESIAKIKEDIMLANKAFVTEESNLIDSYIKRRNLEMKRTGTGLRYSIIKSSEGKKVIAEMRATVTYSVSLLDGSLCYSSDSLGPRTFVVDHDQVESGLHEGLKLMNEGEQAIFILPSHLAFGLTGDNNKIPPGSPVVYKIELIRLD